MPSIGTKYRTESVLVTTKINGPSNVFMFDPKDVHKEVKRIVDDSNIQDGKKLANLVSEGILEQVKYDPNVLWVDCEVLQKDGILFTTVAERQLGYGEYEE